MTDTTLDCGHVAPPLPKAGGAAGYAITTYNTRVCYACAAQYDRALLAIGAPVQAYLHGTGEIVTTWAGHRLANVRRKRETSRNTWTGDTVYTFACEDSEGRWFYGRATLGGVCTLRRYRDQNAARARFTSRPLFRLVLGGEK